MKKNITIEEKIQLLVGRDLWSLHDCNGKIHRVTVTDGPMGVRQPARDNVDGGDLPSISYPSSQTLSCTWNTCIARKVGNAIANDCIDRNIDILLAPGVNIKRTPICGRNFEYYSEDPLLAGQMAKEYILGVQEKHVGTSLKHYCGNNMEYSRLWISSNIDERTLREIYLTAFEIACQAKPWTVMCAYNSVNDVRMAEHKRLYSVLRNEFAFDGAIISDWGAVRDIFASIDAGLDVEMPANEQHVEQLQDAYKNGTLDIVNVEQSAGRLICLADKCQQEAKLRSVDMTVEEREEVSRVCAEEGIVLLKNKNALLPLTTDSHILVTGAPNNYYYFGGGSSAVKLRNKYVPLSQTLLQYCPNTCYFESVTCDRGHCSDMGNLVGCVEMAKKTDVSIVCVGNNDACESESFDRQHIKLSRESVDAIKIIAKNSKKTVVCVYAGSVIDMAEWIDDVDAVVWAGFSGEFVNYALADILVGKVNPSGKTTETFPISLSDVPAMNTHRDERKVVYAEKLNVGYRYFNTANKDVLFPFGYGLSYSRFEYSNIQISGKDCNLTVTFDLENLSKVDGKEVVQLYVRELNPVVERPNKELKAFCKVNVPAGKKVSATLQLNKRSFSYYSTDKNEWIVNPGEFEIQICSSVEDTRLSQIVKVH